MTVVVVFSKDRAVQLDAFLRSWAHHVSPLGMVHVLYLSTTARHEAAYQEVFQQHDFAVPHPQRTFKWTLLELLPALGLVTFFVDDQVFIRSWKTQEACPGLSLRLGLNITRTYASGDRLQPLPLWRALNNSMVTWRWAQGSLDWAYPLSLDGHVFDLLELRPLLEASNFRSPNTLESALQAFLPLYTQREGICYRHSRVVNVPWNRVQTDWDNRHGTEHDAEKLLTLWEGGQRIDVRSLYGVRNESVHQELPLVLEAR